MKHDVIMDGISSTSASRKPSTSGMPAKTPSSNSGIKRNGDGDEDDDDDDEMCDNDNHDDDDAANVLMMMRMLMIRLLLMLILMTMWMSMYHESLLFSNKTVAKHILQLTN